MRKTFSLNEFLFLGFWFVAMSCNRDQIIPKNEHHSIKLNGRYDLISMFSENAVDIDRDGIFSKDILSEIAMLPKTRHPFFPLDPSPYFLEMNTTILLGPPAFYDQRINLWSPYPNVISDELGTYLFTGYGFTNLFCQYKFIEEDNLIKITNGHWGQGEVLSAKINNDVLTIKFIQLHFTTNGWERLTINSTYKRSV